MISEASCVAATSPHMPHSQRCRRAKRSSGRSDRASTKAECALRGTDLSTWITSGQPDAAQCRATCSARPKAVCTSMTMPRLMSPPLPAPCPASRPVALGHQPEDLQLTPVYIFFRPLAPKFGIGAYMRGIGLVLDTARVMLAPCQLFLGLGGEGVEKLGMKKDTARLLAAPFVIGQVEPARQQHVGGTVIGIAPVPAHQRRLVERRRLFRVVGKEHPRPRSALYPQIAVEAVLLNHVIARIEPCGDLHRILPGAVGHRVEPPLGIHVQKHRAKGLDRAAVEPVGQRADGPRVAERVDEELIG